MDQLFTMLEARGVENELKNLWLMTSRVSNVFRAGHVQILKSQHLERNDGKVGNLGEGDGVSTLIPRRDN